MAGPTGLNSNRNIWEFIRKYRQEAYSPVCRVIGNIEQSIDGFGSSSYQLSERLVHKIFTWSQGHPYLRMCSSGLTLITMRFIMSLSTLSYRCLFSTLCLFPLLFCV